ncbi:acyl-CoA desaturase [Ectothiorhodospira lacustris]|uniref:acyl-CoA desaturase n=1 Tax=Ectothiorhodospira lacustris TaxID=2899127 RepID=UPI001EE7C02A|nr:fatty acid desaturase [Ectothiorhodospira lacustris]MCG5501175.1 fatty acid desaturase [Ectothiorhodospira lacustris]
MSGHKPPIAWSTATFFLLTNLAAVTLVPWWGLTQGYSVAAWAAFFVLFALGGLSITVGYHRLWAHRTFKGRWPLRLVLAIFGGMTLQNSIYNWVARHRIHHRFVDDMQRDPHSIKVGFWHAHMGWMMREWPATQADYSQARDLENDPIVMWQHKYYWPLAWTTNLGIPLALGFLTGDLVGMVLLAGVLRLVISHHFTFFINSLAHKWGRQPYSEDNTAVDNALVALLTWGEGYHNYHHAFQNDYRNGVRWWHYDPSKWIINLCAWTGLAHGRRSIPQFKIQRARLDLQFRKLQERLNKEGVAPTWRGVLDREYQQFKDTVQQWQQLQLRRVQAGTAAMCDRWVSTELRTSFKELEYRLKMQRRRLRALSAIAGGPT